MTYTHVFGVYFLHARKEHFTKLDSQVAESHGSVNSFEVPKKEGSKRNALFAQQTQFKEFTTVLDRLFDGSGEDGQGVQSRATKERGGKKPTSHRPGSPGRRCSGKRRL